MIDQTTIEKQVLKIPSTLKALVEALIFAAHEPLSLAQIRSIYQNENERGGELRQLEQETIRQIVTDLNAEYKKNDRPYRIVQIAGGFQFATASEYAEWIGKLYREQGRRKLSQSGVETLAIVAYKQPITKAEIEKIRGVNCDYVLKTLLEKELVTVTGRAESVGRPLLYGTTKEFLKHFGLNDITDLPRPREIEEILGESQFETERRMLEAQAGAELMKKEQEDFKSRLPHIPKKKSDLEEKDVEIVPNKKIREIKIVPSSEQEVLEQAGQEPIDFSKESASPEDLKETPISSQELIVDNRATQNSESVVEKDLVTSNDEMEPAPVEAKLEDEVPQKQESAGTTDSHVSEEQSTKSQDSLKLESEQTQQPKRWKVWKEKIQGFIKKLFA